MLQEKFIRGFLALWATIDPVSTLLIFIAITSGMDDKKRSLMAFKAIMYSGVILIGSLIVGQFVLSALGISLASLSVELIIGALHSGGYVT